MYVIHNFCFAPLAKDSRLLRNIFCGKNKWYIHVYPVSFSCSSSPPKVNEESLPFVSKPAITCILLSDTSEEVTIAMTGHHHCQGEV